jgi:hypothetical protein
MVELSLNDTLQMETCDELNKVKKTCKNNDKQTTLKSREAILVFAHFVNSSSDDDDDDDAAAPRRRRREANASRCAPPLAPGLAAFRCDNDPNERTNEPNDRCG